MSAKVIQIGTSRRRAQPSDQRTGVDTIRLSKTDSQVLLTVGEFEHTLTPNEARQLGEWLTTFAVLLGAQS